MRLIYECTCGGNLYGTFTYGAFVIRCEREGCGKIYVMVGKKMGDFAFIEVSDTMERIKKLIDPILIEQK